MDLNNIQKPCSKEPVTYSFNGGRLPGLVSDQELVEHPPSGSMEGYSSFSNSISSARNSPRSFVHLLPGSVSSPQNSSTSTWNYFVQHVVPASPTDSTGGFSVTSPMDFEADPNRKFGGFFVDPYSPKKNTVKPTFTEPGNSNQFEDYPDIRQELKEARKSPPYLDYICEICKNSTVAEYGRHWVQRCPLKNPHPDTPYQGERRSKGQFKCICGNSFFSENVYAHEKKSCNSCKRLIAPTKMWASKKSQDHIPHDIPYYRNPYHQ